MIPCKRGHTVGRDARGECIECRRIGRKAWRKANPDKVRAAKARWQRSCRDWCSKRDAAYRKAHRAVCLAQKARGKARKRNAPGRGVTATDWTNCRAESLGICVYCNERRPLEMEHVEPLVAGGEHDPENIAAACKSCNSSKSDRPLIAWLAMRRAA